jgi:hypothetical protein
VLSEEERESIHWASYSLNHQRVPQIARDTHHTLRTTYYCSAAQGWDRPTCRLDEP